MIQVEIRFRPTSAPGTELGNSAKACQNSSEALGHVSISGEALSMTKLVIIGQMGVPCLLFGSYRAYVLAIGFFGVTGGSPLEGAPQNLM